jgi:subtilisin family serine protease
MFTQMVFQKYIFSLLLILLTNILFGQKFGIEGISQTNSLKNIPFSLENSPKNNKLLNESNIKIKRITENWIFFSASTDWVLNHIKEENLSDMYIEFSPPVALDDTARVLHNVNQVHNGQAPLINGYTGKGVIIGIVDQGLDHTHPDFIDAFGNTRVLRYWDHSVTNPSQSPAPFNYGQIWYENQINDGTITSNEETTGHGTTVAGIAAGNGSANGKNKGMAPDADLIIVETNFNLPNWSLTVADACDYIFRVADSLNKPAIVNLSVGSYFGSHDATDPAAQLIDFLLGEKNGRLVICATGNAGNLPPRHVQNYITSDTSFVWFKNNPNSNAVFSQNSIFFDLWTDVSDANFHYSLGANLSSGSYQDRASTIFRHTSDNINNTIYDTLRNLAGDQLATLEINTEYVNGNFHMLGIFTNVDSTLYNYRFSTTGNGMYDLWSGQELGGNHIVSNIPNTLSFPPIQHYALPDSLQSIVTSWNCSPKVVSVGNLRNRLGHIDYNGNQYYPATDMTPPGHLALSSSKGPTRKNIVKPDITASGDVTLASGPMWILNDPSNNSLIDVGGFHVRNGGTSMASPTVAGIAALYLERCSNSSWSDFKDDLSSSAQVDLITGITPNYAFGYGKVDAFALMKRTNGNLSIIGDTVICQTPITVSPNQSLNNYNWSNGTNTPNATITQPDTISLSGLNNQGCYIYSDTIEITQGSPLSNPVISILGASLISSSGPNYQWFLNDIPIVGDTNQVTYPTGEGYYSVAVTGTDGCSSFSNAIYWTLNLAENEMSEIKLYPNPTKSHLTVESEGNMIESIRITSVEGKLVYQEYVNNDHHKIDASFLSTGAYLLELNTKKGVKTIKFFKQ